MSGTEHGDVSWREIWKEKVMQLQQTVKKCYSFEGKGLHTGRVAKMTINPAPVGTGIRFRRTDLGEDS